MAMAGRNTRASAREQPGDLPAVRGDEVAIGFGWTVNQALQAESPQVIRHLVGSVIGQRNAQQIRYVLPEIVVAETIDEVLETA